MKNKIYMYLFGFISFIFTFFSVIDITKNTGFLSDLKNEKTLSMLFEFFIIYIILLLINKLGRGATKLYLYTLIISITLYIHQIALALVLVSAYYISFIMMGEVLLLLPRKRRAFPYTKGIIRYAHSFILGIMVYIISICLMSVFKIADLKEIYIFTIAYSLIALILYLYFGFSGLLPVYFVEAMEDNRQAKDKEYLFLNIIFILLIQAGRLNISLDYDSLRYALRSPYILTNGIGIYENLALVNSVYNYPKGLEILTLPLNIGNSYSFIQSFSFISLIFFLFIVYEIVKEESTAYVAIFCTSLMCYIPAIVNMGISAKTDMISLLFQFFAISDFLNFLRNKNKKYIYWAFVSLILSTIFKPTTIVFSGLIAIYFFVYLSIYCIKEKKYRLFDIYGIYLLLLSLFTAALVHLRTFIITGHFFGSVFSGIWESLGFHIKYPYKIESIPNNSYNLGLMEMLYIFKNRFYGLFLSPSSEEMLHVYIAFCGVMILAMFICGVLTYTFSCKLRKNKCISFLNLLSIVIFFMSMYSLYKLYQVDGNYYILLYSLILMVFVLNYKYIFEKYKKLSFTMCVVPCFYSLIFIFLTNWSGNLGNTKIKLVNKGFYEHILDNENDFINSDEKDIYDFLKKEKGSRLISIAYEPRALLFPISSESYTDITGSGGNVVLVKYLDNFKEFLNYAKIDYIYTREDYLRTHDRAKEIVAYMEEDASLHLLIDNGEAKLYRYIK